MVFAVKTIADTAPTKSPKKPPAPPRSNRAKTRGDVSFYSLGVTPKGVAPLRVSLRSWLRHRFAALQAANANAVFFVHLRIINN